MYLQYFGLNELPFTITPDPRFVFLSARHEEALAHLKYGISQGGGGGFVQLTGEVGTGKTTLCRLLLEHLPEDVQAALILNPLVEPTQLLEAICEELGVNQRAAWGNAKKLTDRLNQHLLKAHAAGQTVVVLIDEAQNLSPATLEQVRLLTNLETATQKLLQIILLGQPELRDLLRRADLRQLSQRITARYHLEPLDARETAAYVGHRLKVAGATSNPFTHAALRWLYEESQGVPRLVNIIAERSLLSAYAADRRQIGPTMVRRAAQEIRGDDQRAGPARRWAMAAVLMLAITGAVGTLAWRNDWQLPALATTSDAEAAEPVEIQAAPITPAQPLAETAPPAQPPTAEPRLPTVDFQGAWTTLLDARGVAGSVPADCRWQVAGELHCLARHGSLSEIRRLARPVLVAVDDGYGVVRALGSGQLAWQAGGGGEQTLSDAELEKFWSGRYWDVWEMPGYIPERLSEGDRGPAVLWVKALAAGAVPRYLGDRRDPHFGPALRRWVAEFQDSVGLPADGQLGAETLQQLSRFVEGGR